MKSPLYNRVRLYTYLVILTLTISFGAATGAFTLFEFRIEAQLDRNAHYHARSAQLASDIREQLLPIQSLIESHHTPGAESHVHGPSDLESAQSLLPTALYNIGVVFDEVVELQQTYDQQGFVQTIGKMASAILELGQSNVGPRSASGTTDVKQFEKAVPALLLSAGQLRRLHLVAAADLDRQIEKAIGQRNVVLVTLVSTIAALAVATLAYLMLQIRKAFARQEAADRSRLQSERRYRDLVDTSPNGILEVNLDGTIDFANNAYSRLLQVETDTLAGEKVWSRIADVASQRTLRDEIKSMTEARPAGLTTSSRMRRADGSEIDVEMVWGIRCNTGGEECELIAVVSDITERLKLEAALRQSQKMEAIGQLTGGVAHEFNNLMGVIQGNAELLGDKNGKDAALIDPILRATARGSTLTKQLLSFARKQSLSPQTIDIASLVADMSQLLRRTLGEDIDIEITSSPSLWKVWADASQLEAALLNLAINARDAMPKGGRLIIHCGNIHLKEADVSEYPEIDAGDYVLIAVRDSGIGMSEQVRAQAFEPFFTTKEVGEGTGLGLSMVYGFAEQSGGCATINSQEGHGTTVRICLPRHKTVSQRAGIDETAEIPRGHGEAVLVIEDDREMRELAVKMLKGLGYRAAEVPEAASARAALERGEEFDLVLSDIMLPGGVNGPQFAAEMSARNPDFKVLFMSGYPAEAAKHRSLIGPDKFLLNKPFRKRELAKALRSMLD